MIRALSVVMRQIEGGSRAGVVAEPVERYQQTHRVPSARLPGFDYGRGVFHVVIVTRNRIPWFGRVRNGRVELTDAGRVVHDEWERTGELRPDVTLDAFVVMPDHVHGVLALRGDGGSSSGGIGGESDADAPPTGTVETPRGASLPGTLNGGIDARRAAHHPEWKPNTLGAIVGRFKYACTRRIRATHPAFAWQPRFYDVIIRDGRQLETVRRYIAENPSSWRE
ncbi:MAG: transposase [Bacteroidota bacterium]